VLVSILIVVLIAAIFGWLPEKWKGDVIGTVAPTLTALIVSWVWLGTGPHVRDDHNIAEGRERVRAAERDLEAALRVTRSPDGSLAVTDANVVVTEDTVTTDVVTTDVRVAQDDQRFSSSRLTLPELWAVTHTRLDLYHDIATGQARQSFRNAQAAMLVGFTLLIVFVVVALNASTTAGSVVAGGLGAVAAALAGYVSRTFVKSQETAAAHLRAYFDQPLEFSRYLAAERLVAEADLTREERAEVLTALVQAMVTPPAPNPLPGQVPGQSAQQ
jgi:hypothetical protein